MKTTNGKTILAAYEFLRDRKLTIKKLALMAGINTAELWNFLHGNYFGGIRKVEETIEAFITAEREKPLHLEHDIPFVETTVSRRICDAFRLCQTQNDISVLFGDSGIGKTVACREYAIRNRDSIFIECLPSNSATPLFRRMCELLNLSSTLNLWQSFDAVQKKLRDSRRLVIVDEAEHISERGLDLLRRLNDFTGIPIVLVGLPGLIGNLRGSRGDLKYLSTRIGIAARLNPITEQDAESLVRCWLPSAVGLWPDFWKASKANARRLSKLCKMSNHIATLNECPIDREVIFKAATILIS